MSASDQASDESRPLRVPAAPGVLSSYNERIFEGGSALTRWAHRSRRNGVRELLGSATFDRAADVGTADGWLLRDLRGTGVICQGFGIDIEAEMVAVARDKSAGFTDLTFAQADDPTVPTEAFDLVCCLETLEHVDDVRHVVAQMAQLAKPGGIVVVSVPVEIGPALFAKQVGRWWANRLNDYGYESYTWDELRSAGIFRDTSRLTRTNNFSHKGFDFRSTLEILESEFELLETAYSPLPWSGQWGASTILWKLRRPEPGQADTSEVRDGERTTGLGI